MELLYILYKPSGKKSRYLLFFPLGDRGNKLCGIATGLAPVGEVNRLKANKDRLVQLSLERKLQWIKHHCPVAYKKGYKEIFKNNYTVVSKHPI